VDLPGDIPPRISVIILTLNEADQLFRILEKAKEGFNVECIVSDGGSTDDTEQMARPFSRFMKCEKGRSVQQNRGAKAASGERLLFLHADTELPDHWDFIIRRELKKPLAEAGCFPDDLYQSVDPDWCCARRFSAEASPSVRLKILSLIASQIIFPLCSKEA